MRRILLIMLGLSAFLFAGFSRSGGLVTDSATSLQWQDDYSDNAGNIKTATWTVAIDYCEALSLGGHIDWRLPNKKELLSIVDYGRYTPAISSIFQNTSSSYYWSSTTYAYDTSNAWIVNFDYGHTNGDPKTNTFSVRCVR